PREGIKVALVDRLEHLAMIAGVSAPLPHADPAAVTTALRRAAEHGPFFVLDLPGADRSPSGTPLASLYQAAGRVDLEELVDHHARRLGTTERRVASSLLFQGIAARLWSVLVGCAPAGIVPDLDPTHLGWWRASPLGLRTDRPAGWAPADTTEHAELAIRTVVQANLRPLATALRRDVRIAEGLLWGNASSALVGAVRVAEGGDRARTLAVALLSRAPLRDTTTTIPGEGPLAIRRRSCCLYYRIPGGGLCGDCVLAAS
ncbi:MAG: (2Fe-2S)-binding protein, partial [Actinomycetes bacterium]